MIGTRIAWSARYPELLDVLTLHGQRFLVAVAIDGWKTRQAVIPGHPRKVVAFKDDGPRDAWAITEGEARVLARTARIPDEEIDDNEHRSRNPR